MDLIAQIFSLLKTSYSNLGLGDEILQAHADMLAKTGFVTADNAKAIVEAQKPYLENLQKQNDARATKAAETAEHADRMTGRLQGELSRLKEEVNGWQNKFQEQLQANRQIQHESEVVGARAGKADAEKEEALRKLK